MPGAGMTSGGPRRQAAAPPAEPVAKAAHPAQEAASALFPPGCWAIPRRSLSPLAAPGLRQAHTGEKAAALRGERWVEPGNDPGRDEYGLPPVDIEIPDDARDLDRDVQAYHRELRAQRRHVRIRRLAGPMTRHGMVLPLVAACLALTLLTGSLLTVLSGRQAPLMRARLSPRPTHGVAAGRGRQLPNASVRWQSHEVELRTLAPAVLAWVPTTCLGCGQVLKLLARQAARKGVPFFFVAHDPVAPGGLVNLTNQIGPKYGQQIVNDTRNTLGSTYRLEGVTAIFAHGDGSVEVPDDVVRGLSRSSGLRMFKTRLALLAGSGAAGASSPAQQPAPQGS